MHPKDSILSLTSHSDIVKYLNVRKDPIDLRDKVFQSYFRNEEDLPTQVDLRDRMSMSFTKVRLDVYVTANAIVSGLREYLLKQSGRPFVHLSRLFVYFHEREIEGHIQMIEGPFFEME